MEYRYLRKYNISWERWKGENVCVRKGTLLEAVSPTQGFPPNVLAKKSTDTFYGHELTLLTEGDTAIVIDHHPDEYFVVLILYGESKLWVDVRHFRIVDKDNDFGHL